MLSKPCVESSVGRYFAGIDLEIEQVADRVGVFGAVEAMEPRRRRVRRGGPVELVLEPRRHRLVHGRFGPARAGRRHHARAQLAHDQLERLRMAADVVQIDRIERQFPRRIHPGGLGAFAMAAHAIAVREGRVRWRPSGPVGAVEFAETGFTDVAGVVVGAFAGLGAAAGAAGRCLEPAGAGACADITTAQVSPMKPATMSLFI